ncbi:3-oxoadipate enol-lactonase [Bordetella trematum]|uniref:3-oxoadipate enol-lactone hydrolase n=1 Tax=Bordetella trematum TaxID=123899 RepID=A0A157SEP8_9BORD|nr:3-oxoadipate enol-lactonase [Bordetella trematum]AUL45827.1 3-oxoadipate enol-lactonase [Bordetella trematum]AZR92611.1 3-oxoadipate enol-lactonase [Bordetella trematum]NNH19600.1 3-oxoadipate enol-lactonase [Bordetella trematum]QIM71202.1 3-oxoadipate enol-lactonase [Bordetella trematum]SAI55335.1 3-oxoadipate enol-lactone hydrolase [Bordetella trematum]
MPYADLSQARLYYVVDGPADAPVLVLSNSLGTNADMWAQQVPALSRHFRVVRYDTRGHGRSSVPEGEYRFEQLANDVVELLDHLGVARAHFCGLSMGGPTGLTLALNHPDRIDRLVLCNTAARIGSAQGWTDRIATVQQTGLANMAYGVVERWLTDGFREREPGLTQVLVDMLRRTPDAGYNGNCAALRDADLRPRLGEIRARTLVIAGTHDLAATPADGKYLTEHIGGARYVELDTSHISNWENPEAFTRAVLDFLTE